MTEKFIKRDEDRKVGKMDWQGQEVDDRVCTFKKTCLNV